MSGIDATSLDVIKGFYDGIFQTTITVSGTKVAEVAKLIENIFRFVNISMDNEMAMPAASLGVNVWESFTPPQPIPSSRGFTPAGNRLALPTHRPISSRGRSSWNSASLYAWSSRTT